MKNYHLNLFITLFSVFFLSCSLFCQEKKTEEAIISASQREISKFLEMIPKGMEPEFGFNSRDKFVEVELLPPLNLVFPSSDFYENRMLDTTNVNYFFSQSWLIPISVDDRICCFLKGKIIDDDFKVFTIGGSLLAQRLNKLDKNHIKSKKSVILFPKLKTQYLIYHNGTLQYSNSKCISLNENFESEPIYYQNLFEVSYRNKNIIDESK